MKKILLTLFCISSVSAFASVGDGPILQYNQKKLAEDMNTMANIMWNSPINGCYQEINKTLSKQKVSNMVVLIGEHPDIFFNTSPKVAKAYRDAAAADFYVDWLISYSILNGFLAADTPAKFNKLFCTNEHALDIYTSNFMKISMSLKLK